MKESIVSESSNLVADKVVGYLLVGLKTPAMCFTLVIFALVSLFWRAVIFSEDRRQVLYSITVSFFCKILLWIMNVNLTANRPSSNHKGYLLVGNHMGVLDIFLVASICPTLFITSVDMKETPGLGFVTELGGCLYVERRNRLRIREEIEEIRMVLKRGLNIVLFPEGTSTNGETVLPFKKSLLTSAAGTNSPICPFVINFRKVNGEPMSVKWRDHVTWYGDHSFVAAMARTLSCKRIDAEIEFLEPVFVQSEEQRSEIAQNLHQRISSKFVSLI